MTQTKNAISSSNVADSVLVFTSKQYEWMQAIQKNYSQFHQLDVETNLVQYLIKNPYSVVIIDETSLDTSVLSLVRELRSRFPILIMLVLTFNISDDYVSSLFGAGVDDVVEAGIEDLSVLGRLNMLLRQHAKNKNLLKQSHRLHAINLISQEFYNMAMPIEVIQHAIESLCNQLGFYGAAIVIDEGNSKYHLYASSQAYNGPHIYNSVADMKRFDPLRYVADTGMSVILQDIKSHVHYSPIPGISEPRSAMVLNLKYGQKSLGALALFSEASDFTMDDLATYELMATHFASAYQNAQHNYDREEDIRFKQQQVKALQALASVYDFDSVIATSHNLIAEIENVDKVVLFTFRTVELEQRVQVHSKDERLVKLMEMLHEDDALNQFITQYNVGLRPISLSRRELAGTLLEELCILMETTHLVFVPISANTLLGGVFVARTGNHRFTPQDVNLMESITRSTAQTIEQNTLIAEIQQQKGRLEGVVRSIREAIFFVNERGNVVFCNPQFTELTTIAPSQVLNHPYEDLLKALAKETNNPEEVYKQLGTTVQSILADSTADEDYPVLEIKLAKQNSNLYVEFMKSNDFQDTSGWIGLIHPLRSQSGRTSLAAKQALITEVFENASIPLIDMQKTALVLPEQYDKLRPRQYFQLLARFQDQVQGVQTLWQNLHEIYEMELSGLKLKMSLAQPDEVINDTLSSYRFDKFRHDIVVNVEPPTVRVEMDERYFIRAINNVLEFLNYHARPNAPFVIQVVAEGNDVLVNIQDKTKVLAEEDLNTVFELDSQNQEVTDDYPYRLGMYVSREIIKEHGGELSVDSFRGIGLLVKVQLPIAEADGTIPERTKSIARPSASAKLKAVVLEHPEAKLDNLYDILRFDGHELFVEEELENALANLGLTQVDLIIVTSNGQRKHLMSTITAIREKTDIPVLLTLPAEAEKNGLQALEAGADAYILAPITSDKIAAQMKSLAQRKTIAARVTPPIQIGDLHINFSRRAVYLGNELLELTGKEYDVLQYMAMNKGQVLTHEQILTQVWGPEYRDDKQYLWVSVSRLRRKLEPEKNSPRYLMTKKGVGYILREP